MFRGLNRLLMAALVAGAAVTAVLAGPSAALASCNGSVSAVNVYKECLQTGGGGRPTGANSQGPRATSPATGPTAKALSHAGKDRRVLASLVRGYGQRRTLQGSQPGGPVAAPSAVGSAFDLSSGPTALLVVLAGTALLLLGGSSLRVWRNRHRA